MGGFAFLSVIILCWGFCGTLFIPNRKIFRVGRLYEENSSTGHMLSSGIEKMYPRNRRYWNEDDNPDKRSDKNGVWFGPRLGRTIQEADVFDDRSWIVINDYPSFSNAILNEKLTIPGSMEYS